MNEHLGKFSINCLVEYVNLNKTQRQVLVRCIHYMKLYTGVSVGENGQKGPENDQKGTKKGPKRDQKVPKRTRKDQKEPKRTKKGPFELKQSRYRVWCNKALYIPPLMTGPGEGVDPPECPTTCRGCGSYDLLFVELLGPPPTCSQTCSQTPTRADPSRPG